MKTVIGLVSHAKNVQPTIEHLQQMGFKKDKISILTNPDVVWRRLGRNQGNLIIKEIGLGALAGIVVTNLFALLGILGTMVFHEFDPTLAIVMALHSTFIGASLGGILGGLNGTSTVEVMDHVYTESVRHGSAFIAVETSDHLATRTIDLLQKDNVAAVKIHTEADLTDEITSLTGGLHFPPAPTTA